ncbi:hypothetical protein PM022_20615, partial [Halorubrum ezzemoulense]|uniref:hypothetical protein n=1 Tax=Halorubrum ezzemoulense TaxID=337243 RepID=UPI00232D1056
LANVESAYSWLLSSKNDSTACSTPIWVSEFRVIVSNYKRTIFTTGVGFVRPVLLAHLSGVGYRAVAVLYCGDAAGSNPVAPVSLHYVSETRDGVDFSIKNPTAPRIEFVM